MNDAELKKENAALRRQNKNLKGLLEEALGIIRKMKDFIDRESDESGTGRSSPARTKQKRVAIKKKHQKTIQA
ncbi:MAG: hypothetical protein QOD56_1053 [Gammaproteobacteria bacterium]|nr:hypothetical protein [Gammaproteobacteria bacterium]